MVRERINEVLDFARGESPYRAANKGWIKDDLYFQWGSLPEKSMKEGTEFANVSLYWKPVNEVFSIILIVFFLATAFVLGAVSLSHGKFDLAFESSLSIPEVDSVFDQALSEEPQISSINPSTPDDLVAEKIQSKSVAINEPSLLVRKEEKQDLKKSVNMLQPKKQL